MWPSSARTINYNLSPELGMFVVAPTSSFHHHDSILSDHHVGLGVIPLLAASPCLTVPANLGTGEETEFFANRTGNRSNGIQFWNQPHLQQTTPQQISYLKKPDHHQNNSVNLLQNIGNTNVNINGGVYGNNSSAALTATSSSGTATCQDCGNQAKKDCTHQRCRTCCKSRGFDCSTHVKSTWVPASRRRERQLMAAAVAVTPGSSASSSGAKKPRLFVSQQTTTTTTSHTSTPDNTPPRSFDATSNRQDGSYKEALPGHVRAPATFKCVRVTAVDDGDDEYAYQAVVKIGGHVFKGFLYDKGAETRDAFPSMSELNLGGARNRVSSPGLDATDVYAATGGALLGGDGSAYGNPMN